MTEPQAWTLIGVFAAGLFGMMTLMSTMFVRVIRTEIGSVRVEVGSVRTEVSARIDRLQTELRAEIRRLDQRLDSLDRDVQAIAHRVFGTDQA